MNQRRVSPVVIAVLAWVLAACSAPQGPSLNATETYAGIQRLWEDGSSIGSSAAWGQLPIDAIAAVGSAALPTASPAGALPRGIYAYDDLADAWVQTGASDDLELNWTHEAVAYTLRVDWDVSGPTVSVEDATGAVFEVPTGAAVALTADGVEVGAAALGSGWTANQCGYDEPASASLSGYFGVAGTRVSIDRLALGVEDTEGTDTITVAVAASATADGDTLSGYLDLIVYGQLARDTDCSVVDFAPQAGTVAGGASVRVGGVQRSLDLQTNVSALVFEAGTLVSVDLAGTVRLDGVVATSFVGALNDANLNGIPGDELDLTFADDETMTLEEFLIDQVGWAPLAVLRLLAR